MMIVIDTSALIAILREEPSADRLLCVLRDASERRISAATWVETSIVAAGRRGSERDMDRLDALLQTLVMTVTPVDLRQARLARAAFLAYGKGRHPAGLNFGDCFSYALAKAFDAPLLFVGGDFSKTDVQRINADNPWPYP